MGSYQLKLLVLSLSAILTIVTTAFTMDWFVFRVAAQTFVIDLRAIEVCAGPCVRVPLGQLDGMFPALAGLAFWCTLPLLLLLGLQCGARLIAHTGHELIAKLGYASAAIVILAALGAGYLFGPNTGQFIGGDIFVSVERTWAPLLLAVGALVGMVALRYALIPADEVEPDYTPIVVPKEAVAAAKQRARSPSTAPVPQTTSVPPPAETSHEKTASPPPAALAPIDGPDELPARARTSSSGPVDVAARLSGAPIALAMRPPLPSPELIPLDQIPVAPESGLTIRKRSTSTTPPLATDRLRAKSPTAEPLALDPLRMKSPTGSPIVPRPRTPSTAAAMTSGLAAAYASAAPPSLRGQIRYAVATATLTGAGIDARREDGLGRLVEWTNIVGIVARRLPRAAPYASVPFVDVISTAGATLRVLPWSDISGHALDEDPVERARMLVQLLAAQCLDAKLDAATKAFASGTGPPAQLPDDAILARHDAKLA